MKKLLILITIFYYGTALGSLLDAPLPIVEQPKKSLSTQMDKLAFESAQKCSEWIYDHFSFVEDFQFWHWFQRFSVTYQSSSVKCDEDSQQCFASFYTNYRGQPEGGGCDLVGTPFWSQVLTLLKDEVKRLESGEKSLEPEYFGMQCRYSKGQSPFVGDCELTRRTHQAILVEEEKRRERRDKLKPIDSRFNRNYLFY